MERTHEPAREDNGFLPPAFRSGAPPGAAPAAVPVERKTAAVAAAASNDKLFLMVVSNGQ